MPVLPWVVVLLLGALLAVVCRLFYACLLQNGRNVLRIEDLERQLAGRSTPERDRRRHLPEHDLIDSPVRANPQRVDGLDINPAEDGYIINQPEHNRVHFLNASAVLILELCNGDNSEREIADLIRDGYGLEENPTETVGETLAKMKAEGLLR
jgi:Coenzyme PQQ synthesis protein D (PqqD)